jgi:hypothetical protein
MKISEALRAAAEHMAEVGHFQAGRDAPQFTDYVGPKVCPVVALMRVADTGLALSTDWLDYVVRAGQGTDDLREAKDIPRWSDGVSDEEAILCLKRAAELAEADGK